MSPTSYPEDETVRLQTLYALDVLDTPPDPVLDGLVRSAARALRCPAAAVSLVDADRQWFKAAVGTQQTQTPRAVAFCAHAILKAGPLVVPDALEDARFAGNPLVVGAPPVRAYAGWPLTVDGHRLGTLCVSDHVPHAFDAADLEMLRDLAGAVEHWLQARQIQVALVERERDLRQLAAQVPGVVYRAALDADSATLYVSPRLTDLGHDPADWMARPGAWRDALHPDDRDATLAELHAAVADGRPVNLQYRLADGAGGWRHVLDRAQVQRGPGMADGWLLGVMIDQTSLLESQRWQRWLLAAVEQASEAIVITDLDGRIAYVNRAACDSSGWTREQLLGANPRIFRSPLTPPAVHAAMWAALRAGDTWHGVLHNQRRDGSTYVERVALRPVRDETETTTHYVAVKQDVTEQRRLRRELDRYTAQLDALVTQRTAELERARSAAEAASAAKSAFVATVSHELRTPLGGVLGMAELLQQSGLAAAQRELTDAIAEAGAMMMSLVSDLLDFSKVEAGRVDLAHEPVALRPLAEAVADTLLPQALRSQVDLHLFVDPEVPLSWHGDGLRLRQIATNLAGNAVKFSSGRPLQGQVSMRWTRPVPDRLRLTVQDNGIGIDAAMRARLFQPFEQGATGRGGTGLGLAISQRLARAMGGEITLLDVPGPGAAFQLDLPACGAAAAPPPDARLQGLHVALALAPTMADPAADRLTPQRRTDWASWLRAAGVAVTDGAALPASAPPDVVFDGNAMQDHLSQCDPAITSRVTEQGPARVQVGPGARRNALHVGPGLAILDATAAHEQAVCDAAALSAGRGPAHPSPEPPMVGPAASTQPTPAPVPAPVGRVLVADDNPVNRMLLEQQLQHLNVAADVVDDGAQALARWRADGHRYALLLTDLQMPVMDGWALAAAIRAEQTTGPLRLPILALSAQAVGADAEPFRQAGFDGHLGKPLSLETLRAALAAWLPGFEAG